MSAFLNLVEGSKQMEQERKAREAFLRNEEEKQARDFKEQQAQAETTGAEEDEPAEETPEFAELVFPEGMSDSEKLLLMTSAITNLTNSIKGGNK